MSRYPLGSTIHERVFIFTSEKCGLHCVRLRGDTVIAGREQEERAVRRGMHERSLEIRKQNSICRGKKLKTNEIGQ